MQFPIKMRVLSVDRFTPPGCDPQVEVNYKVVDGVGEEIVPRRHFVCKEREFDVVAAYTIERITARMVEAKRGDLEGATPEIEAVLASIRGEQTPIAIGPDPTPLDQTISPPGPQRGSRVK